MLKYKIPQIVTLTRIFPLIYRVSRALLLLVLTILKDMIDTKKARQTVCLTGFCFISD